MGTNCLWVHMLRARVSAPVKVCIVRILVVEISLMLCVSCAERPKAETGGRALCCIARYFASCLCRAQVRLSPTP